MNEIYKAITNKIDETSLTVHNDFYTSIGGRYYTERAKQEATFPYCVGHFLTAFDDSTFTEQLDRILFQFNIYSNSNYSAVELGNIYTDLRSLMDNTILTVDDHTFYYMRWQNASPRWIPNEEVWQYFVEYEIEIEQSR